MLYQILFKNAGEKLDFLKDMGLQNTERQPLVEEVPAFIIELEDRIQKLDKLMALTGMELKILSRLRDYILEIFGDHEEPEPESKAPEKKPEKPEKTDKPKEAEPPKEPETTDAENPSDPASLRRGILKTGIKSALNAYKKAPLSKRYKGPGRINKLLELSIKHSSGLTENEHIVRMEAAIGEALMFLHNSPLAARSKSLTEAGKILEETIDKKNQL